MGFWGALISTWILFLVKITQRRKRRRKAQESGTKVDQTAANTEDPNEPTWEKTNGKSSKVRTFGNGLVIEDLSLGQPDGKRASPGQKVSVRYIGKLKNGKIFDSNVGGPPFKFRLGIGQVMSGWDVGVNGMRVGDKRRLTIPPEMGCGHKLDGTIPPSLMLSWLLLIDSAVEMFVPLPILNIFLSCWENQS